MCGKEGSWWRGGQEARAEIKSLNCCIFHLHLLFYGGWGPASNSGCDSWTSGRPMSGPIPHRQSAARTPEAPTQLLWWIWLVFVVLGFFFYSFTSLPSSGFSGNGVMFNAATELSEINNFRFTLHPRPMRAEPAETGREQILGDKHTWRKREGDPDKQEINMGRGVCS